MTKLSEQVAEFMNAFEQPMRATPGVPDRAIARLRLRLIAEEFFELIHAGGVMPETNAYIEYDLSLVRLESDVLRFIDTMSIDVSLSDFADALADIDYVIEGARLAFGIEGESIADEVHAANMRKVGGPVDEFGKQRKPDGWTGPNIESVLVRQGWKP